MTARKLSELIVLVRGGGEVASGIAYKLHRCHFRVCLTEMPRPMAVSRGTTFSEAVFDGIKTIEGVTAEFVPTSVKEIVKAWEGGKIAVVIDPGAGIKEQLKPDVLVDATMAKRVKGTGITDAPLVIGVGPGFFAGRDVHVVVESNHSNNLGRVLLEGKAEDDTGTPVNIGGFARERVIWAPQAGVFISKLKIGDTIAARQTMGQVDGVPLAAPMSGILRGLIRSGVKVAKGDKLIEIDPVNDSAICFTMRDKMRTIAGGVLEAILLKLNTDG